VYFLDESGMDHCLYRPCARSPQGQPVYTDVARGQRGRTSIISASRNGRLVSPMTFERHYNSAVVDACFSDVLLPSIPPGSAIVLDNASFYAGSPHRRSWKPVVVR